MAGHSGTPLAENPGIKPGHRVGLIGAPQGFASTLAPLPDNVTVRAQARGTFDVMVFFTHREAELTRRFDKIQVAIKIEVTNIETVSTFTNRREIW